MKGDYKMREKYYRLDTNLSIDANYRVLPTGRNVGKSYALKEYAIKQAYESNFEKSVSSTCDATTATSQNHSATSISAIFR